jgi:hypothetical protein
MLAAMLIVRPFSENKCKRGKSTHRSWFAAVPTAAALDLKVALSHYVA